MNDQSSLREIVIQGKEFVLQVPYEDGHTLNKAEAAQLNQVYLENIGNNFRARVKELVDAGTADDEIQKELEAYAEKYEFGTRRAGGPRKFINPVEREMRALARTAVVKFFKSKDMNFNEFSTEQKEEAIQKYLTKYGESIRPEAERRVQFQSAIGEASLD